MFKIKALPKVDKNMFSNGYYLIDATDYAFKKVIINYNNPDVAYKDKGKFKQRTVTANKDSNFKKNPATQKYQLSFSIIYIVTEVVHENKIEPDIYEETFIFTANPINKLVEVKNNINLKRDIFDLKIKYNDEYWSNHEILPLTNEMQEFINKVNASENSDFKSKTNIK